MKAVKLQAEVQQGRKLVLDLPAEVREGPIEVIVLYSEDEAPGTWARVDAIYSRLAATGRTFGDSAELLREDRDR